MKKIKKVIKYLCFDKNRGLYYRAVVYSGFFRLLILVVPIKHIKKHIGVSGEESDWEIDEQYYPYVKSVARVTNTVCSHTWWKSLCLVRALTAQRLLKVKKISSTLYLGCKKEGDTLVAHAWIRCGPKYVLGGSGQDYAMVAKFRS